MKNLQKELAITLGMRYTPHMTSGERQRFAFLDICRIVAMLMVCFLHINYSYAAHHLGLNMPVQRVCLIAVDLYVLISGFLYIKIRWKLHRYIRLWAQVAFYTIGIWLLARYFLPGGSPMSMKNYLLPVPFASAYWFFNAYTVLFFCIPFLNKMLLALDKWQHLLLVILILLFCGLDFISSATYLDDGYNYRLMTCLYIIGAYFRLHPVRISAAWVLVLYALVLTAQWLCDEAGLEYSRAFAYSNPIIICSAISIFLLMGTSN